ncbi:MAG: sigma-70 family RNA polymerase sigma factor [Deltaproteobacteria bacterium]|nr:MAG: sigma-70 family RNA polymerase sigma factor [Deltaproteobacteria bacterium]
MNTMNTRRDSKKPTPYNVQPSKTYGIGTDEPPLSYRLVLSEKLDLYASSRGLWGATPTADTVGGQDPSQESFGDKLTQALHHAVESVLTDKQREAIFLFFFEGLSQGDIARRLGISQQVVQKRIYGTVRNGQRVGGALRKLHDALLPYVTASHPPLTSDALHQSHSESHENQTTMEPTKEFGPRSCALDVRRRRERVLHRQTNSSPTPFGTRKRQSP